MTSFPAGVANRAAGSSWKAENYVRKEGELQGASRFTAAKGSKETSR